MRLSNRHSYLRRALEVVAGVCCGGRWVERSRAVEERRLRQRKSPPFYRKLIWVSIEILWRRQLPTPEGLSFDWVARRNRLSATECLYFTREIGCQVVARQTVYNSIRHRTLILLENRDTSSRSDLLSQRLNFSYLLVQIKVGASFNMNESGFCNGHWFPP